MEIDRRHCFDCDRRLDEPAPVSHGRLWRCSDCQADVDAHIAALGDLQTMPPPLFHGTIALGTPLPGWPTATTLLALEVWDRFSQLRYVEIPGPTPPAHPRAAATSLLGGQPPRKWVLTTDTGTVHHGGGGSGGTPGTDQLLAWEQDIAPTLPLQFRRLDVRAQSPGATATTSIDRSTRPLTRRAAAVDRDDPSPGDADPECASCGPPLPAPPADPDAGLGPELDWAMPEPPEPDRGAWRVPDRRPVCVVCRSNQEAVLAAKVPTSAEPDEVIALGAHLGPLFGADLVIPTLIRWPTWFDLAIVGHHRGAWSGLPSPTRATRWSARDDQGRHYIGATTGGGTGLGLARKDLTFTPALASDATALTISMPAAIDGRAHHVALDLHPGPTPIHR